jgi:hypothetical protein
MRVLGKLCAGLGLALRDLGYFLQGAPLKTYPAEQSNTEVDESMKRSLAA